MWSRTRALIGEAPLSADSDFNWTESADPDRKLVKSADSDLADRVCRNQSESADSDRLQTQTNIYASKSAEINEKRMVQGFHIEGVMVKI